MTRDDRIPAFQVERILRTIEEVMNAMDSSPVSRDLVEKVVKLEVEYQFVDDRDRVQKRIKQIVDEYVDDKPPTSSGADFA